jgi:hypothetical protein
MKKLLLVTVACAATAVTGFGQEVGSVNFNTKTVNAVVTDMDGAPVGAGYLGQLVWGTAEGSLLPVGTATEFYTGGLSSRKGTVSGGNVEIAGAGDIAGFMQLLVWDGAAGGDYDTSKANGGQTGMSGVFAITPTAAPKPPADLVGLQSFQLGGEVIPEPSTFALGLIGIGALMLRRRK